VARAAEGSRRSLEAITDRLLVLLAQYQMPATWAVSDPALSASRKQIAAARGGHELAILGDTSWVGREAPRSRFARELTRRATAARATGVPVETLILRAALPVDHCDLAIKEGIVAVRHPTASGPNHQPRTLRFGLWSFPLSIELPGERRWLPGGGGVRAARMTIDEGAASHGLVQLAVDAPRLAARGAAAVRALSRVLDHVERRRQSGLVDVTTIGASARRFGLENRGEPSRSILRPAA
jgi:hypothetical protein